MHAAKQQYCKQLKDKVKFIRENSNSTKNIGTILNVKQGITALKNFNIQSVQQVDNDDVMKEMRFYEIIRKGCI